MTEMIIPGTYIEVRDEGLITAGRIATGTIGVVGTASSGEVGRPLVLSGFGEAYERFGLPDDINLPAPLTLVRALKQIYDNGATDVIALRVAGSQARSASCTLFDTNNQKALVLAAKTPGTWGNELAVRVEEATADCWIEEDLAPSGSVRRLTYTPLAASSRNRISVRVKKDKTELMLSLQASSSEPRPKKTVLLLEDGTLDFGEVVVRSEDTVRAAYYVDRSVCVKVTITYGAAAAESYTVPDVIWLDSQLKTSRLVTVQELVASTPTALAQFPAGEVRFFGTAADDQLGTNGEHAEPEDYEEGLEQLVEQPVNIVVLAGQTADQVASVLTAHLNKAQSVDRERIAVVDAPIPASGAVADISDKALSHGLSHDRVVVVAPGLRYGPDHPYPAPYAAAAVAGMLAALPPHISPTNKAITVPGLFVELSRAHQKELLKGNVLVLVRREGALRALQGITTDSAAYRQITVRRIVDYARYGVRSACNPYIGRLNNPRVRDALKATIDGFLTAMVTDEMLTAYLLEVSATRDQEKQGIVSVVMTIQPTFSIDFIKVTMILQ